MEAHRFEKKRTVATFMIGKYHLEMIFLLLAVILLCTALK